MSKELPYFKFYPDQWITGDITLEEMSIQGVFINVCANYWAKDCSVSIAKLKKRYGEAIDRLLNSGMIKELDGFVRISFLDEQWLQLSKYHNKNVQNGLKGAEKRWGGYSDPNSPAIAFTEDKIRKEEREETPHTLKEEIFSFFKTKMGGGFSADQIEQSADRFILLKNPEQLNGSWQKQAEAWMKLEKPQKEIQEETSKQFKEL